MEAAMATSYPTSPGVTFARLFTSLDWYSPTDPMQRAIGFSPGRLRFRDLYGLKSLDESTIVLNSFAETLT
jgi:hypothetical protein